MTNHKIPAVVARQTCVSAANQNGWALGAEADRVTVSPSPGKSITELRSSRTCYTVKMPNKPKKEKVSRRFESNLSGS